MSLPLFYVDGDRIEPPGGSIVLYGDNARHLSRSLRARTGDSVLVGDGKGTRFVTKVSSVDGHQVILVVESCEELVREIPELTLIQAVSEPRRMDEAVARAAETGIAKITPFVSARAKSGARERSRSRLERWRKIARESSMVARRAWLLEVGELETWPLDGELLSSNEINVVLWEGEIQTELRHVMSPKIHGSIGVVVGPEGGFAPYEVDEFVASGGKRASLGRLILRAESAGSYAAMLIRYHYKLLSPAGASKSG